MRGRHRRHRGRGEQRRGQDADERRGRVSQAHARSAKQGGGGAHPGVRSQRRVGA
ncbi:hypothetical protein AZ78_4327 [Lysobacter capsici AZ78]|uniref:Uncharacterized protein n=1 Tax=Lysobacter capsici AZ78 TaxID=1444315 RepID=A0A108UD72_9GAMM|nr:hypothetical protein AZ78_4327 [Lysobacter capsici AZ78]